MGQDITTTRDQQIIGLDAIDQGLARYAEMSQGAFSPNTLRAIASDTRIFQTWCIATQRSYIPATSDAVAAFIDDMGQTKKPATVAAMWPRSIICIAPLTSYPPVGGMLRG